MKHLLFIQIFLLLSACSLNPGKDNEFAARMSSIQNSDIVCRWNYRNETLSIDRVHYGKAAVEKISPIGLNLIVGVVNALEDETFVENLATLIERDYLDLPNDQVPSEYAGLGLETDEGIRLLQIHSVTDLRFKKSFDDEYFVEDLNYSHTMPQWAIDSIPHSFWWHIHAAPDLQEQGVCGPEYSSLSRFLGGGDDIRLTLNRAYFYGEFHGFVFTRQEERTFAVHYFGGGVDKEGPYSLVINLPIYHY